MSLTTLSCFVGLVLAGVACRPELVPPAPRAVVPAGSRAPSPSPPPPPPQPAAQPPTVLWDLARTDEQLLAGDDELFSVLDNEWSGCWSPIGTDVSSIRLEPPQLHTKAGRVELTLQLDARRGRVTAPYLARCRAIEDEADPAAAQALPRPRALLRHSRERVLFRFDGSKFVGPPTN